MDLGNLPKMRAATLVTLLAFVSFGPGGNLILCRGADGHVAIEPASSPCCGKASYPVGGGAISGGCGGCEDLRIGSLFAFPMVQKPVLLTPPSAAPSDIPAGLQASSLRFGGEGGSGSTPHPGSPAGSSGTLSHLRTIVLRI